jgi:hypothetical protein
MEKRTVTKKGCKGTIYDWHFSVDEENGELRLDDVKVHGESILEVMDEDLIQSAYHEQYHKWINQEA